MSERRGPHPDWHKFSIRQQAELLMLKLKIEPADAEEKEEYIEEIIEFIIKPVRDKMP